VYSFLGLSCAAAVADDAPPANRAAFAADITYVTGQRLCFTYLRDNTTQVGGRGGAGARPGACRPARQRCSGARGGGMERCMRPRLSTLPLLRPCRGGQSGPSAPSRPPGRLPPPPSPLARAPACLCARCRVRPRWRCPPRCATRWWTRRTASCWTSRATRSS
jgi:hypothetical protein